MSITANRVRSILILIAFVLGFIEMLALLLFPGYTTIRDIVFATASCTLWIPALVCYKYPRVGLAIFVALLSISFFSDLIPYQYPYQFDLGKSIYDWGYDMVFGLLMIIPLSFNLIASCTRL